MIFPQGLRDYATTQAPNTGSALSAPSAVENTPMPTPKPQAPSFQSPLPELHPST